MFCKKPGTNSTNNRLFFLWAISLLVPILLLAPRPAGAADLASTGDWLQTVDSSCLISGAGSDLIDTYQSPVITTTLEISGCLEETEEWWILIKRVDQIWDDGHFVLYAQRTSDGTGAGIISGGDSYQEVTPTDAVFFSGQGDRSGITIQYQLTGISVQIPPANYRTVVEFTLTP